MALPKLNALPRFEVVIPSSKKLVKYRPFLVKEQKVLLMALETQDQRSIYNAMVDVITACVEDNTSLSNLTTYDVEYMFLMIRSKSVGETIQLKMGCSEDQCDAQTPANIVIDDIAIPKVESTTTIIELEPGISIELEHPSIIRVQETTTNSKNVTEGTLALMKAAIKNVLTEEERIVFKEESVKEQDEFIENLKTSQLDEIYKFISSIPTMEYDLEWTCDGCGNNNQRKLRGWLIFLIALSHDSLENYYKVNYQLMQNHHYSLSEVENMMPWEREIYLFMLTEDMQRQREEQQKARMQQGRR